MNEVANNSDAANDSARAVETPAQDALGRFLPGNRLGTQKLTTQRMTRYRKAFFNAVSDDEMSDIARAMVQLAVNGDVAAARFVAEYTIGKPIPQELEVDQATNAGQLVINLVSPTNKN